MIRVMTWLQLAAVCAVVTSCSTTEERQLIDESDFRGKTFNAVISTSGISLLGDKSMVETKSEITFNDTTGQLRLTKRGRAQALDFAWHLGEDSLAIKLAAGAASRMKVQRYSEGFALIDKEGGMLLVPSQ
ncbi:hypothetical protein [Fibrella forsythiae]|uniref:DUF306 domain-containing protein n=1 Tax=Fibrella forsythiae TaxID=2817061 RepID=A0ABS3JT36_9BACT|nr:hypothetical protein [Fibrella forsythiae]MBO0953178.1 hypothetical protein [Fibrella forsythiae]